jgi:hypothetical protein
MIPYEIDPSLYTAEPEPPVLDGGFSPPPPNEHAAEPDGDFAAPAQAPAGPAARSSS